MMERITGRFTKKTEFNGQGGANGQNPVKGYVSSLLSAILYGTGPLIVTLVYQRGLGVNSVSFLRVAFPVPLLALAVLLKKNASFRITGRELLQIAILALTNSVLTSQLLFRAIRYIDTGTATTLNFTYPVLVILMDRLLYRQKCPKAVRVSIVLCMLGILMFCNPRGVFTWKGFFLGLASGVAFAVYVLYLDRSGIMHAMGFLPFTFYFFLVSAVLMLPIVLLSGEMKGEIPTAGWLLCLAFALADGLLATVFQEFGVHIIGGKASSIISAMEPVTSVTLGIVLLHEQIQVRNILGVILILAAGIYLVIRGREQ